MARLPGHSDAHEGAGAKARLSELGEVVRFEHPMAFGSVGGSGLRCTCFVPDTQVSRGSGWFWRFRSGLNL